MPIIVSCQCGKRFAAPDDCAGQTAPCPACGRSLLISAENSSGQGIYVSCSCGRAFMAGSTLRGKRVNCPSCGGLIRVPRWDSDRRSPAQPDMATGPMDATPPSALPPAEPDGEIPWDMLKLILGGGVLVLVVLAIIISTVQYIRTKPQAADSNSPAAQSHKEATSRALPGKSGGSSTASALAVRVGRGLPPPPSAPVPDAAVADATTAAGESTAKRTSVKSASDGGVPLAHLPEAAQEWYTQDGPLTGLHGAPESETAVGRFSWLTQLLPYLGHKQLYDQFDFQKPIEGKNLAAGAALVPELLNPLDDNQRWRGYPFPGLALSHIVGISGVEDARNVVAAKLPRTDPRAGVFGYDDVARPKDITDGQSQTAMIAGAGALANPWVLGGGATIRGAREPLFDKTSGLGTKGLAGGGSIVVMADGSVRQVSAGIDPRVFKAMSTIRGAESVDLQQAGSPFDVQELKPQ
jgi:hypothetical protein